jgi:GntR family transcriptional repressor for pyruvate dehydrogenase complex
MVIPFSMEGGVMFQAYKGRRAFEDIAEQIKQAILSEQLSDGDRLSSERDLAEQFQVGRVTIREAMRMLETMGLVEIRKGSAGGAFVRIGDPDTMASMIMDRLLFEGTTHEQMIEARVGIECAVIKSAIENATDEDLAVIEQDVEESKQIIGSPLSEEVVAKMISFHIFVAEASHNVPYIMFVRSMMEWASRKLTEWAPSEEEQRYSYTSHKEIFEAMARRDAVLAERLMREHIEDMGVMLSKFAKRKAS